MAYSTYKLFLTLLVHRSCQPKIPMYSQLKPGKFVRLKDQPHDLPDFVLERYLGDFCWIRQQAWGQCIQWKVNAERIEPAAG